MKQKKLVFILHSLSVGGAERRAASIANYLVDNGFDVEIILLDNPDVKFNIDKRIRIVFVCDNYNKQNYCMNNVTCFSVDRRSATIFHKIRLAFYQVFDKKLFEAYNQLEYFIQTYSNKIIDYVKTKDECILISWMTFLNISTCYANRKLHNEMIFVECTSPETEYPEEHPMNILKKKYYPIANKCICQTPDEAKFYDFLKITKKKIIPNPIVETFPERFIGERRKVIVSFCRLEPLKNIPLLIDAFCLLKEKYPEYKLHIYGNGSQKEELIKYAMQKRLGNSVAFFDFDVNLHKKIRDCSMFVTSSNREGMSNSMLEAMAIGLPTISTDCPAGAAKMLIENNVNGIVIPMNDAEAMYEAMKYIIDNPKEAEKMSSNATKIRNSLSMERIGSMWKKAIYD